MPSNVEKAIDTWIRLVHNNQSLLAVDRPQYPMMGRCRTLLCIFWYFDHFIPNNIDKMKGRVSLSPNVQRDRVASKTQKTLCTNCKYSLYQASGGSCILSEVDFRKKMRTLAEGEQ